MLSLLISRYAVLFLQIDILFDQGQGAILSCPVTGGISNRHAKRRQNASEPWSSATLARTHLRLGLHHLLDVLYRNKVIARRISPADAVRVVFKLLYSEHVPHVILISLRHFVSFWLEALEADDLATILEIQKSVD